MEDSGGRHQYLCSTLRAYISELGVAEVLIPGRRFGEVMCFWFGLLVGGGHYQERKWIIDSSGEKGLQKEKSYQLLCLVESYGWFHHYVSTRLPSLANLSNADLTTIAENMQSTFW